MSKKLSDAEFGRMARPALERLVALYVANRGTDSEFISCITPLSASKMTYAQRRACKVWRAFDSAGELLGDFDEEAAAA
jgi:hypothetical protein